MIPLHWYLLVAAGLFSLGLYGVLARRNAVAILMSIELMLNGQMFAIVVFAVAAAEAAVGLALIISVYRNRETVIVEDINMLKW